MGCERERERERDRFICIKSEEEYDEQKRIWNELFYVRTMRVNLDNTDIRGHIIIQMKFNGLNNKIMDQMVLNQAQLRKNYKEQWSITEETEQERLG